ncbi:unnamed protein product [Ixodes pacificus]
MIHRMHKKLFYSASCNHELHLKMHIQALHGALLHWAIQIMLSLFSVFFMQATLYLFRECNIIEYIVGCEDCFYTFHCHQLTVYHSKHHKLLLISISGQLGLRSCSVLSRLELLKLL